MTADSALLDKLPACFRAIRESRGKWWLTSAPDVAYDSVREVIDAYREPVSAPSLVEPLEHIANVEGDCVSWCGACRLIDPQTGEQR